MADIGKILDGFRHCFPKTEEDEFLYCDNCPYEASCSRELVSVPMPIFEDFYEFLKEQEPRLLTFNEVINAKYPMDIIAESIKGGERVFAMTAPVPKAWYPDINKSVRFWTTRPTKEQRKATPWELD